METCHTNIHSLSVIKTSIIKHFKLATNTKDSNARKNSKKSSGIIETVVKFDDSDKLDYYLFKIDDTIKKWEIIEMAVGDEQASSSRLDKLEHELRPLRERVEYVGNLSRAESLPMSSDFESLETLRVKIEKLEEESLSFVSVLSQINACKQEYNTIKEQKPDDVDMPKETQLRFVSIEKDIGDVEELHRTASVE